MPLASNKTPAHSVGGDHVGSPPPQGVKNCPSPSPLGWFREGLVESQDFRHGSVINVATFTKVLEKTAQTAGGPTLIPSQQR